MKWQAGRRQRSGAITLHFHLEQLIKVEDEQLVFHAECFYLGSNA